MSYIRRCVTHMRFSFHYSDLPAYKFRHCALYVDTVTSWCRKNNDIEKFIYIWICKYHNIP